MLDTNAVLDWLVFADRAMAPLAAAIQSRSVRWLATEAMRQEAIWVVAREQARSAPRRWPFDLEVLANAWAAWASPVEPVAEAPAAVDGRRLHCRDASDQMFIDLAMNGSARWLVTRDRELLRLAVAARPWGVAVTTPERWHAG